MEYTTEFDSSETLTKTHSRDEFAKTNDENVFLGDVNINFCESSHTICEEKDENFHYDEIDDKLYLENNLNSKHSFNSYSESNDSHSYCENHKYVQHNFQKLENLNSEIIKESSVVDNSRQSNAVQNGSVHSEYIDTIRCNIINPFLSMENSNNAIDNNISSKLTDNMFKLPNGEFNFNGKIQHFERTECNDLISMHANVECSSKPLLNSELSRSSAEFNAENCSEIASIMDDNNVSDTESNNSKIEPSKSSYNSGTHSPDIFLDDEYDESIEKSSNNIAELINTYDKKLARRLEVLLQSVPPPPSVTISRLKPSEILDLYNKNLERFENSVSKESEGKSEDSCNGNDLNTSLKELSKRMEPSLSQLYSFTTQQEVLTANWPSISTNRYFGLHYNCSHNSEILDTMFTSCISRTVGSETASSFVAAVRLNKTPIKRRIRSSTMPSPGRRLSHLARRRILYNNLRNNHVIGRQILVDRRKYASINIAKLQTIRRSPRIKSTPSKKTPRKKTPKSKTPLRKSSSKKKSLQKKSATENVRAKRALFTSNDSKIEDVHAIPSTSKLTRSKRALFVSPSKDNWSSIDGMQSDASCEASQSGIASKRIRLDSSSNSSVIFDTTSSAQKAKLIKSYSFSGDKLRDNSQSKAFSRHASEDLSNTNKFSDVHKRKLIWAVQEALRTHNIGVKHENFKLHMTSLAKLTQRLSTLSQHAHALRTPGNSTSDTLLRIARQHSFAVIKGRPIDLIYSEEEMKQNNLQASKSTSVPVNRTEYLLSQPTTSNRSNENMFGNISNPKFNCNLNAKTVLQDKTVNIDLRSSGSQNSVTKIDKYLNGKVQACTHLNYDNLNKDDR